MSKIEKKIPKKNYIILLILFLLTFLLTYYIYRWYVVYSNYQNNIPVIKDSLVELTEEEMEHYISDNPTTTIYICTASDINCRNFEKSFKRFVDQKVLKEYIAYVNLSNNDENGFIDRFNSRYHYRKSALSKYPALVYFEDGQISDILQETATEKITISDVKQFIKRNKIGSNY